MKTFLGDQIVRIQSKNLPNMHALHISISIACISPSFAMFSQICHISFDITISDVTFNTFTGSGH